MRRAVKTFLKEHYLNFDFFALVSEANYGVLLRISMRKKKEYRAKQKEISKKITKLNYADEEYYLISEYLLKLASNAGKLFESSEVHEKRLLLKMTLQNLELKGKKVRYGLIKPFDTILNYADRQL